jgi:hypothetical protein
MVISEEALHKTIQSAKALGLCVVMGAEAGYLTAGPEGAKIGAAVGLVVGTGLLIYFCCKDDSPENGFYPFPSTLTA